MSAPAEVFDLHADRIPPADPFTLARQWLPPDEDPDRPRVTLATAGTDGCPNARTVLLSAFDETGFAFHTAASSRKAAELAALPSAAMVVLWPEPARQLVVRGEVVADAAGPAAAAWAARTPYLRQLAWLNTDELAVLPLAERRSRWTEFTPAHPDPASSWSGYRLRPAELIFWAGAADTASRRLQYTRAGEVWTWRHLAG